MADLGPWSVILAPDANIDRRKCHRTTPLEVLNLGVSRTGSLSMTEAFRVLGYAQPYHFTSIFANIKDADMWSQALKAKYCNDKGQHQPFGRREFDQLLGHTGAVSDTPVFVMWCELVAAYPDAKVILTIVDEERWLTSCEALLRSTFNPIAPVLSLLDPFWFGRIYRVGWLWTVGWFNTKSNPTFETCMANARGSFREHYRQVRETVPQDRLLEYRLGSGWEPLCQFLGKEIPDVPFPHLNERKTLDAAFGAFFGRALKNVAFNFAILLGIVMVLAGILYSSWNSSSSIS